MQETATREMATDHQLDTILDLAEQKRIGAVYRMTVRDIREGKIPTRDFAADFIAALMNCEDLA